jgi:protein arginine N-methyltransferase 1
MLDYHRLLLDDEPRTIAFREALRRVVKPGDVVVDLGSGSGILSYFAVEAGARKVYAIERGHMADVIALMVRQLGLTDRIEVLHETSAKVELPERGDVLVSEMLGAFALQEQILSIFIDARTRLLTPNARLIPSRFALTAVPVERPADHELHVGSWSKPRYGIDFSVLRAFAANQLFTKDIAPADYLAQPAEIMSVDLTTITETTITGSVSFEAIRAGTLHGFGGWFTATLAEDVMLTNLDASHWRQEYFPIDEPLPLTPGMIVTLELQSHDGKAWRWRGRAGEREFDQTTWLASPPCIRGTH